MIKILLLIIYLVNDDVVIERKVFDTVEACNIAGGTRVAEVSLHPKFQEGIWAGCVRTRVKEA